MAVSGSVISLKNNSNLTNNRLARWDTASSQFKNSAVTDDDSNVTSTLPVDIQHAGAQFRLLFDATDFATFAVDTNQDLTITNEIYPN